MTTQSVLLALSLLGTGACGSETGAGGQGGQPSPAGASDQGAAGQGAASQGGGGAGGADDCLPSDTRCEVPEDECAELCCSGSVRPDGGLGSTGSTVVMWYACE